MGASGPGAARSWHPAAMTRGSRAHWRGALLGTALGDAVGAPFEGRRRVEAGQVERWLAADGPLVWTDDTAMTLGLARSLVARGGRVDPQHLGDVFAADFRAEPWRGYGPGPPRVFAAAERGTPYREAAGALFDGSGSFGNGGAMRAAPAAVVARGDPTTAATLAREQAAVTHAHPLGRDGAALVALAVGALATAGGTPAAEAVGAVLDHLATDAMRRAATTALELGPRGETGAVVRALGNGIAALEAVPAALAAFLGAPDDPRAVLTAAVRLGGDTDTIAAMAGALVGARAGADRLPPALLERLEARAAITAAADALVDLGDAGR